MCLTRITASSQASQLEYPDLSSSMPRISWTRRNLCWMKELLRLALANLRWNTSSYSQVWSSSILLPIRSLSGRSLVISEVGAWSEWRFRQSQGHCEEKCPDCAHSAVVLVLHKERQHNIVIIVIPPSLKLNPQSPIPHLCPARCAALSCLGMGIPWEQWTSFRINQLTP